MDLSRVDVGLLDEIDVCVRVVRADLFQDVIQANHQRSPKRTASRKLRQTTTNAVRRSVPAVDSAFVVRRLTHAPSGSYARAPMVTCPACGKENEDSAYECKRCRAPLREEEPQAKLAASQSLGDVCRRCEAYNEPGVTVCTNCGLPLFAESGQPPDTTPPSGFTPPTQVPETLSEELRALAISDEEAAEAGLTLATRNGIPSDKTPPEPFAVSGLAPPAPAARPRVGEAVAGAAAGPAPARRPPPAPPSPSSRMEPPPEALAIAAALPANKPCTSCGARNPPAAKFCFDCGTPFAKKASSVPPPPSIEIAADLGAETFEDSTMQSAPVPAEEPVPADSVAEPS